MLVKEATARNQAIIKTNDNFTLKGTIFYDEKNIETNSLMKIHLKVSSVFWHHFIQSPFYYYGLILNPAWISNHMHRKVWDEITDPFPNFNDCAVEVWEWISDFIPHIIMTVITYPCWDWR